MAKAIGNGSTWPDFLDKWGFPIVIFAGIFVICFVALFIAKSPTELYASKCASRWKGSRFEYRFVAPNCQIKTEDGWINEEFYRYQPQKG